jgi:hypothetical protein
LVVFKRARVLSVPVFEFSGFLLAWS